MHLSHDLKKKLIVYMREDERLSQSISMFYAGRVGTALQHMQNAADAAGLLTYLSTLTQASSTQVCAAWTQFRRFMRAHPPTDVCSTPSIEEIRIAREKLHASFDIELVKLVSKLAMKLKAPVVSVATAPLKLTDYNGSRTLLVPVAGKNQAGKYAGYALDDEALALYRRIRDRRKTDVGPLCPLSKGLFKTAQILLTAKTQTA